ncbi:MAG: DUF3108 domain-containing protein [Pseudomonadota bacterium]
MVGERLRFNIAFWVFPKAGIAEMTLRPLQGRPGFHEAMLVGQTLGVIGFFTRYRKDTYRSVMELVGGRLRPLEFHEEVIIGRDVRRKRTTSFDYAARLAVRRTFRGTGEERENYPMASGVVYDDYLSGLYNLRSGAYGPLREGRAYFLNIPRKHGLIRMDMAGREETRKLLEWDPGTRTFPKQYFSRISMEKQDLGSGTGRLSGWFDPCGVPLTGVVEDVAWFGDVTGTLFSREGGRPI